MDKKRVVMKDEESFNPENITSPTSDGSTEEISKDDKVFLSVNALEDKRCYGRLRHLPKVVFGIIAVAVIGVAIYDWKVILQLFKALILWVKEDPFKAAIVLMLVYALLIVTSMPIVFLTVPLGYAFHMAFDGRFGNILDHQNHFSRLPIRLVNSDYRHHDWRCSLFLH